MRNLFFLLFIMSSMAVDGQTISITTTTNPSFPLPSKTVNYINVGVTSGEFLDVRYINTTPILLLGEILISSATIHLGELSLGFESQAHEMDQDGYLKFTGKNKTGYMGLVSHYNYNGLSGYIHSVQGYWEIITITEDVSIVVKKDLENSSSMESDYNYSGVDGGAAVNLCDPTNDCKSLVDVLVLIPPDVKMWYKDKYGGLFASDYATFLHIQSSLLSANQAIQNSTDYQFSMAESQRMGVRYCLSWTEAFSYSSDPIDLNRLLDDLSYLETNFSTERGKYNADVLCLWTSKSYGAIHGIVNSLDPENGNSVMIARVEQNLAPRWTFAHEIAHLTGARHNRSSNGGNDNATICNHAWRYNSSGTMDRTCLALAGSGNQRILHYSNPNVKFSGNSTGTIDDNNSLAIINGSCELKDVNPPAFLSVLLDGSRTVCLSEFEQIITANVKEAALGNIGHPPYDYSWSIRSGPGAIVTMPFANYVTLQYDNCPTGCTIVVGCGVRSADSQSPFSGWSYDEIEVKVDAACRKTKTKDKNELQMVLYPNPVSDYLNVLYGDNEISEVKILDLEGKTIKTVRKSRRIDISDIPVGTYIGHVYINGEIKCKKFIKL